MKTLKLLFALLIASSCFADTGWLFQPLYSQGTNNPTQTSTAGHVGTLYFNNSQSPGQVFIKTDDYPSTNWVSITSGANPYFVTCTANAATATTIVHCLPSTKLVTGQVAYVNDVHALVSGSTAWGQSPGCTVQDTTGTAFVTITGLTANAYSTSGTTTNTRALAFSTGAGGTAGAGIDLVCSANGTGSPLVVTVSGVIK